MYFFHNSFSCIVFAAVPCVLLLLLPWAACLELVAVLYFLPHGAVQKTVVMLHYVVPFGHSFPSVVTLSCSARNCLRNRCGVA